MFTRCPECDTVFRVTANQLRAARGDVRCGNCAHIFNAMEYLTDAVPSHEREGTASPMAETGGTEGQTPASMEFDAPEQTWSEFFIEAQSVGGDIALDGELEAITADPEEWRSMLAEISGDDVMFGLRAEPDEPTEDQLVPITDQTDSSALPDDDHAGEGADPEPDSAAANWHPEAASDLPAPVGHTTATEDSAGAGAEIAFDDRLPADELPPWSDEIEDEQPAPLPAHNRRWAGVALLLCLTLVLQLAHQSRDALAAHPRYGEWVRNFYARLDERLYPDWPLEAFSVRRSEALAGGSAPNALDINAAVDVSGAQPVGLPLVRVTLRDQWANTVGSRLFGPADYLAEDLPDIVPPGTRIPVSLSLADPGTAARGYEVDLCLPRRTAGLECQQAPSPFRQ